MSMEPCHHDVATLVHAAVMGGMASAVAAQDGCEKCRSLLRSIQAQAARIPRSERIVDCDDAEVILAEIDEGLHDADQLAALVVHMRECSLCHEQIAPMVDTQSLQPRGGEADEAFVLRGSDRFEIKKRIGAGGMGVVYEAYDRKHNVTVALKTLRDLSAQALYRLKNEFRERQDLQHPNLVTLGELIEQEGQWFFTMELVDGVDFLAYVRPPPSPEQKASTLSWQTEETLDVPRAVGGARHPATGNRSSSSGRHRLRGEGGSRVASGRVGYDEVRLRSALRQLCLALQVLHKAGKVHRDIKPSNILITEAGHLVLLDFGLITDVESESAQFDTAGTPAYMAPEQAEGKVVGPAADLYSVGVILYQALTGKRPYPSEKLDLFLGKGTQALTSPRELEPAIPVALDALCMKLLAFTPTERPTIPEMLSLLRGAHPDGGPRDTSVHTGGPDAGPLCVGRDSELQALWDAFAALTSGTGTTVLVHGEPGIGRSALLQQFRVLVREQHGDAVVLAGRCYERESVPYKAFDKVIDALSRYLAQLDQDLAAQLMPPWARILDRVFPVLSRVECIADMPPLSRTELAPRELRSRMFAALRQLLSNIACRVPVVILIDDFHWADADSLAVLEEILKPPDAPALLLVAAVRDAAGSAAVVDRLAGRIPGPVKRLALGRLARGSAIELADALLSQLSVDYLPSPAVVASEADGHPLFIYELVRGAALGESTSTRFDKALWLRIDKLDGSARRLLEMTVVAAAPMDQSILGRAAGIDASMRDRCVADLRSAYLIRAATQPGWLEPYHERVSAAVAKKLDSQAARSCHERLAWALEAASIESQSRPPALETLAVHWRGAGDGVRAARYATRAAAQASKALAFEQATRLYRLALDLTPERSKERHGLYAKLGHALANAGRGIDSAAAFREAAACADGGKALEYRHRAAESLLAAGRVDEALSVLEQVLGEIGVNLPRSRGRARISLLARRASIDWRRGGGATTESADDSSSKLDISWSASIALGLVDPVRSADCLARHRALAERSRDPDRRTRAMLLDAAQRILLGKRRADAILDRLEGLEHSDSTARFIAAVDALRSLTQGRWQSAHDRSEEVVARVRQSGAELSFAMGLAEVCRLRALAYMGRITDLRNLVEQRLHEASEYGGRHGYLKSYIQSGASIVCWLGYGELPAARHHQAEAENHWASDRGLLLPQIEDLLARHQLHLYADEALAAWEHVESVWPALERTGFLDYQILRIECLAVRARSALAAARKNGERRLLRIASRDAGRLAGEKPPYARLFAGMIQGGIAALGGDDETAASHLRACIDGFESAGMNLYAATARYRLAEIVAGSGGEELRRAADRWLNEQQVVDATRLLAVLSPGF